MSNVKMFFSPLGYEMHKCMCILLIGKNIHGKLAKACLMDKVKECTGGWYALYVNPIQQKDPPLSIHQFTGQTQSIDL